MIRINNIGVVLNYDHNSYSNNIPAYVLFGSRHDICKQNIIIRYVFRSKNSINTSRFAAPALIYSKTLQSKKYYKNIWAINGKQFINQDDYLNCLVKISTELAEICITNEEFFKW